MTLAYPNTSVFQTVTTTLLARTGLINCIINLRAKRRHEKIQKEKDRSPSLLAVSTTQKVHLVTFG